ncbi:MAG: Trm112 family protein [Actinobacteria bacterium]|nr:Trm112 family protein [Actinomycetota bacterium]
MALDNELLDILVCPEDKGPLWYFPDDGFLYNPRLHRSYEIRDDIPVLLVTEAVDVDADSAATLQQRFDAGDVRSTGEG